MQQWKFTTMYIVMYKAESWYKLRGGRILVQIAPLQDFGTEVGGWAFTPGWVYTPNIMVHDYCIVW